MSAYRACITLFFAAACLSFLISDQPIPALCFMLAAAIMAWEEQ